MNGRCRSASTESVDCPELERTNRTALAGARKGTPMQGSGVSRGAGAAGAAAHVTKGWGPEGRPGGAARHGCTAFGRRVDEDALVGRPCGRPPRPGFRGPSWRRRGRGGAVCRWELKLDVPSVSVTAAGVTLVLRALRGRRWRSSKLLVTRGRRERHRRWTHPRLALANNPSGGEASAVRHGGRARGLQELAQTCDISTRRERVLFASS